MARKKKEVIEEVVETPVEETPVVEDPVVEEVPVETFVEEEPAPVEDPVADEVPEQEVPVEEPTKKKKTKVTITEEAKETDTTKKSKPETTKESISDFVKNTTVYKIKSDKHILFAHYTGVVKVLESDENWVTVDILSKSTSSHVIGYLKVR